MQLPAGAWAGEPQEARQPADSFQSPLQAGDIPYRTASGPVCPPCTQHDLWSVDPWASITAVWPPLPSLPGCLSPQGPRGRGFSAHLALLTIPASLSAPCPSLGSAGLAKGPPCPRVGTPANADACLSCKMAPSVEPTPNCVAFTSGKEGMKRKPHAGLTQGAC